MRSLRRHCVPAMAIVVLAALSACTQSTPAPPNGPPSTTPPSRSSSADARADLRTRLAAALRTQYAYSAEMVERPLTTLTPVDAPWLTGAEIVDVANSELAHPRRFYAAIGAEGIGFVLTGRPDDFNALTTTSAGPVDSAAAAQAVVATYLDTTRDFRHWSYRVAGVDDIEWSPRLTSDQQATRAEVEHVYATKITEPTATAAGGGWRLTAWMVDGRSLVSHDLTITRAGVVSDTITTAYAGLPVPESY